MKHVLALLSMLAAVQPPSDTAPSGGVPATQTPATQTPATQTPAAPAVPAAEATGDPLARAFALTEAGEHEEAADAWRTVDLGASDDETRALARFNLGMTLVRSARAALDPVPAPQTSPGTPATQGASQQQSAGPSREDFERAIATLRRAAAATRAVLDVRPGDAEAARHVERIRRLIRETEQQRQEQQQQQQQQQQDGEQDEQQEEEQQQGDQGQEDQQQQEQEGSEGNEEQEEQSLAERLLERERRQSERRQENVRRQTIRAVPVERDW